MCNWSCVVLLYDNLKISVKKNTEFIFHILFSIHCFFLPPRRYTLFVAAILSFSEQSQGAMNYIT